MESEVREVSFEEALAEERESDQEETIAPEPARPRPTPASTPPSPPPHRESDEDAPPPPPSSDSEKDTIIQEAEEELAVLAPPVEAVKWEFGTGEFKREYIQSELSVIGSAQWFKLLGEFLDEAMSGENAMSLNSILSAPTPRAGAGQFSLADFQDADMFVQALGKLLTVMPEFLEKSVCIWLAVPDYEWDLVRQLMRQSPKAGGMTHDQFEGIVATFIDQNYAEVDRFFRERYPRLRDRWRARAKEASRSRSQKR